MIRLNKKIEYAMIAILHLAKQEDELLVNAGEIADIYNIPPELLGKVMQKLVRANLIKSVQGANGGYYLNKPLNQLNLFSIIDKIEGPLGITTCTIDEGEKCSCKQLETCNIKHAVGDVQNEINKFFSGITLDKFIKLKN